MMLLCGWRKRRNNKSSTSSNQRQATNTSSSDEHETNDNAPPIATTTTIATATVKPGDDNSTENSNKSMFFFLLFCFICFRFTWYYFHLVHFLYRFVLLPSSASPLREQSSQRNKWNKTMTIKKKTKPTISNHYPL